MSELENRYLTTKELAALLRIKERKVYELVANEEVPCSRATGKLLFPREAVEKWLVQNGSGFQGKHAESRPNVVLGSHDPLLDWAIRESGCGLATFYDGSGDGLRRFVAGEGVMAGLHLFDAETGNWNIDTVKEQCRECEAVLVEFGWRDRGLLLAQGNPHQVTEFGDIIHLKLAARQAGAGAEMLLNDQLAKNRLDPKKLNRTMVARTETEAASAITSGEVDVAFGLRAVARQHQLDFIPITRERFDLLVDRQAWFQPAFQILLQFMRSKAFSEKVDVMPGYDCSNLGTVHYNTP